MNQRGRGQPPPVVIGIRDLPDLVASWIVQFEQEMVVFNAIWKPYFFSRDIWVIKAVPFLLMPYNEYALLLWFNLILLLLWIPQIYRNTMEDRRQANSWKFVFSLQFIVASLCYVHAKVVLLLTSDGLFWQLKVMVAWLAIQCVWLYLQLLLGPRFWIPYHHKLFPWHYQPILTLADLELKISLSVLEGMELDDRGGNGEVIDYQCTCPICWTMVTIPILKHFQANLPIDREMEYAVTPSHHVFHAECLVIWLRYGSRCPFCASKIPRNQPF